MTIPSQFADWLAVSARDGKGGNTAEPPAITRGRAFAVVLSLAAHPVFDDWTAGTFAARLRASPDAAGDPLATYSCATGAVVGLLTPVTLTLTQAVSAALPAVEVTTGLGELFLEVTFTPTGGTEDEIISTRQLVKGKI